MSERPTRNGAKRTRAEVKTQAQRTRSRREQGKTAAAEEDEKFMPGSMFFVVLITILLFFGVYFFGSNRAEGAENPAPTPTEVIEAHSPTVGGGEGPSTWSKVRGYGSNLWLAVKGDINTLVAKREVQLSTQAKVLDAKEKDIQSLILEYKAEIHETSRQRQAYLDALRKLQACVDVAVPGVISAAGGDQ